MTGKDIMLKTLGSYLKWDTAHVQCRNAIDAAIVQIMKEKDVEIARLTAATRRVVEALEHMRWCRSCGESSWDDCDGGKAANAALADPIIVALRRE